MIGVRTYTPVSDPGDPRVDVYRGLRGRDATTRRHGFIVEGRMALERSITGAGYPLASVLVSSRRQALLAPLLERLGPEVDIFLVEQGVFDHICGYSVHRGILAYGRQPSVTAPSELLARLGARALLVCAVGVNDVENMGAIFRNAAAFGADGVLLDASCCDPLFRRSIRVSIGAVLVTPFARLPTGEDLPRLLGERGLDVLALSPRGETALEAVTSPRRTAVLVGAEGEGLPEALLTRCRTVRIPMHGGFDSLNVATALAVALHQLRCRS